METQTPPSDQAAAAGRAVFHVVSALPMIGDDYEIVGIYSLEQDAAAHSARLHADGDGGVCHRGIAVSECLTMPQILAMLGNQRLGEMARVIERHFAHIPGWRHLVSEPRVPY